jgi:hypothetical protein
VEAELGGGAWQVIRPAWEEQHCDVLAAIAGALDQVWVAAKTGGTSAFRVVVRLAGLPEIVNVLVAEVAARAAAAHYRQPLPTLADQLRQIGAVVCASTGAAGCACLGACLEPRGVAAAPERLAIAAVPEPLGITVYQELVQHLIDELDLPALVNRGAMPPLEDMFRVLVAPTAQPSSPAGPPPVEAPEWGSRLEASLDRIHQTRDRDAVTRPLYFGAPGE